MAFNTRLGLVLLAAALVIPAASVAKKKNARVNLTIKNADVRDVLTYLAQEADQNLVMSDAVTGQVTLNLRRVRVGQAVRAVLASASLEAVSRDGIVVVMTRAEFMRYLDAEKKKYEADPPPPRILP